MIAARLMTAALMILGCCPPGVWAAACPDDPDSDLCDTSSMETSSAGRSQICSALAVLLAGVLGGSGESFPAVALLLLPLALSPLTAEAVASTGAATAANTCGSMKSMYKAAGCCGNPDKSSNLQVVPVSDHKLFTTNMCAGKKPEWNNTQCIVDNVKKTLEQAGANVTKGYVGGFDVGGRMPITGSYFSKGLCPVNVHWHLGAEHLSVGEYDEHGTGPAGAHRRLATDAREHRRLATDARQGYQCHKYKDEAKFTTEYNWQHCVGMHVGETYEVHWPHSSLGACNTPYQYQSPFYDGVFCHYDPTGAHSGLTPQDIAYSVGVHSQVFTIVNDEHYYYPDMMRGMLIGGDYGKDVAKYTGSTTGTSRHNEMCSSYTPITWQVDRKCHLISASSFDKMCADMKTQSDDMSSDLYAHGSRELVAKELAANNLQP